MYDVPCTLRAFQIVQSRWPEATLTLVGGGSQDAHLRALAGKLGLRNVTFRGALPPDQMADVYAEADLYVQTPEIDNMPVSVLEAFASGTPVVSTRAGGVPAMLTDEEHGLLAPVGDHEAVARTVLRLLGDPELASRLARQAHAACHAYTWDATREQWLNAYRSVLQRPRSATAPVHAQ
jgi:glycosyltransferase involved in cell wall biosynthesis